MRRSKSALRPSTVVIAALEALLIGTAVAARASGHPGLELTALIAASLVLVSWLVVRVLRRLLWRVGSQLAFSYLLVGAVPIPLLALLVVAGGYLSSGALVGYWFLDELSGIRGDLQEEARVSLAVLRRTGIGPAGSLEHVRLAYYQASERIAGTDSAPEVLPEVLLEEPSTDPGATGLHLLAGPDGKPSLAVAYGDPDGYAAVALLSPPALGPYLSRRCGIRVELQRPSERRKGMRIQIGDLQFRAGGLLKGPPEGQSDPSQPVRIPLVDRQLLFWAENLGPLRSYDGEILEPQLAAVLNAAPKALYQEITSGSSDLDTRAWGLFLVLSFLLLDVYVVALAVALIVIWRLTQAVNRLSRATEAVGSGDLTYRIPVRRRDQLGELQHSFNEMARHLRNLVDTAAEKERLERELELARQLQQRLLPAQLLHTESVRFASFFEPSAAIGGDYYDLVHIDDDRLLVVIADVSGHGISAGLRMAMLKGALVTLLNEGFAAEEILSRLDRMIRDERQGRFLVTATLSLLDVRTGSLVITNAGHPPTYRIRGREVDEVMLPSAPLGALSQNCGSQRLSLEDNDLVVWLSDGLIEAMGTDGDVFGYDRLSRALGQGAASAHELRDQLLAEVRSFTGGAPPEDDCTLLVLHYRAPAALPDASEASSSE